MYVEKVCVLCSIHDTITKIFEVFGIIFSGNETTTTSVFVHAERMIVFARRVKIKNHSRCYRETSKKIL